MRKERAPRSGSRESGESQLWQRGTSENRKEGDRQQLPECRNSGLLEKGIRGEEALPRQYGGTAGERARVGLPRVDTHTKQYAVFSG